MAINYFINQVQIVCKCFDPKIMKFDQLWLKIVHTV